ncbi:MAG: hypothetical protein HY710_10740 [Candidatus Latescibacteria bacterium]|nr:hypothetical protein [Candidatus Latescibacterota bacterium]
METYIPAASPLPLPAPGSFFWVLLLVTFWFHFLAVQVLLGTLIITLVESVSGKPRDQVMEGLKRLPVIMAFVINLGIPPLLFLQLLYAPFFYTSSVLMGIPWLLTIPLLIVCYGCLYLARYTRHEGRIPLWLVISLASGLTIAYFFSNNVTWMLKPETWAAAYQSNPLGAHLYPTPGDVIFRWLWAIAPAVTVVAAWLHKSRAWGWVTVVLGGAGGWLFRQHLGAQADAAHRLFLIDFALLAALVVVLVAIRPAGLFYRLLALWAVVKVVVMVALRDAVRRGALEGHQRLADLPVQTNWSVVVCFLAVLVIGLYTLVWMYRRGKEGLAL